MTMTVVLLKAQDFKQVHPEPRKNQWSSETYVQSNSNTGEVFLETLKVNKIVV